jgi:hypothetical protein
MQHCSSAMTSLCTGKAIRAYFNDGELPPNGIVCPTDEVLFPPESDVASLQSLNWLDREAHAYSVEDLELLKTLRELGTALDPFVSTFKRPRALGGM